MKGRRGMGFIMLAHSISRGDVMENFRVVVWCQSCRGDDEGCFGGGNGLIDGAFESWEDADKAGVHYCAQLPYQYRIVHTGSLQEFTPASDPFAGSMPL